LGIAVHPWWSPAAQTERRHHHVENVCNLQNKVSGKDLCRYRQRAYQDPSLVHGLSGPGGIGLVEFDNPVKGVCNAGWLALQGIDTAIFEVCEDVGLDLRLAQISRE
jgi:hypothetical protein